MENWKEDFEVLFGEVERSENIRVFIEDLLEEQAREAMANYFRGAEIDALIAEVEGAIDMSGGRTHDGFYEKLLGKLKGLDKLSKK